MAREDERFVRIFDEGSSWSTRREFWVDKRTGVNYLWCSSGYAGGMTPLLQPDGRPVVTSVRPDEE